MATLSIKPFVYGGILIGAALFGLGMAVFGLCPGTSVAACGEGNRHAIVGLLGMLTGAFVFVASYPIIEPWIAGLGDGGKLTVPDLLKVSPWFVIAGLLLVIAGFLTVVEYFERNPHQKTPRVARGFQEPRPAARGVQS
jgi:hypothetical protein